MDPAATNPSWNKHWNLLFLYGFACCLLGIVSLATIAFGEYLHLGVRSFLPLMKANTALCLIAGGLALLLRAGMVEPRLSSLAAGFVWIVSGLTSLEYLANVDLGIDGLLASDMARTPYPGRMAPGAAASFFMLSIALLFQSRPAAWSFIFSAALSLLALGLAIVALTGHVLQLPSLYRFDPYTGVAATTAIGLVILASGTLLLSTRSARDMLLLTPGRDGVGSPLMRRQANTLRSVLLVAALLCAAIGGSAALIFATINAQQLVERGMKFETDSERLLGTIRDAELGQRGYILTGKANYLEPYTQAVERLPADLARIRELTSTDAAQQNRLTKIEDLAAQKMSELRTTLNVMADSGRNAAMTIVDTDAGKMTMDAIRAELAAMSLVEKNALVARQQQSRGTEVAGIAATLLSFLLTVGLGLSVQGAMRDQINALRASEGELETINADLDQRIAARTRDLSQSEERYRALAEATTTVIWHANTDGEITFGSKRWNEITGQTDADKLGTGWLNMVHPEDVQRILGMWQHSLKTGTLYESVFRVLARDGRWTFQHSRGVPVFDTSGAAREWIGANTDITQRKLAEQQLSDAADRLRLALDAGQMGTWDWDLASDNLIIDDNLWRMMGHEGNRPTNLSAKWFLEHVVPEDLGGLMEQLDEQKKSRTRFMAEFRIRQPGGNVCWLASKGEYVIAADGNPSRMIGVNYDITLRKNADEHLEFLMKEMSHRSKNLLAIIQGIARQTARSSNDLAQFQASFADRLQSLGSSQDIILGHNWSGAPLGELVVRQLSPFAAQKGDATIEAADRGVVLTVAAAQAVGLALHELATNAVKYGALSVPSGKVIVSWERLDQDGASAVRLIWTERGGPRVSEPTRKGFGHTVIERMVASTVEGEVELAFNPDGLRWNLKIPPEHVIHNMQKKRYDIEFMSDYSENSALAG